jgi:hypothetical protein
MLAPRNHKLNLKVKYIIGEWPILKTLGQFMPKEVKTKLKKLQSFET